MPTPPVPPLPSLPAAERIRLAYQRRSQTDYQFSFWTAFGWSILTCGIYGYYVFYQLMRRMREHNNRRLEELDAAAQFAWEKASQQGQNDELRENFERIQGNLAVLRSMQNDFRDPTVWLLIAIGVGVVGTIATVASRARGNFVGFGSLVVYWVGYIFLDQDLVKHDYHEGAIENDLAIVFGRLDHHIPAPDPNLLKKPYNYAGRIIASIFTCGIYSLFWLYNQMQDPNEHFRRNWAWEDALAGAVQSMS